MPAIHPIDRVDGGGGRSDSGCRMGGKSLLKADNAVRPDTLAQADNLLGKVIDPGELKFSPGLSKRSASLCLYFYWIIPWTLRKV